MNIEYLYKEYISSKFLKYWFYKLYIYPEKKFIYSFYVFVISFLPVLIQKKEKKRKSGDFLHLLFT